MGLRSRPGPGAEWSEAEWVDVGVDDLTKYRIVEYLYRHPGDEAEVSFLASALGFHSLEQTLSALEELAAHGVVWLASRPEQPGRCGLTAAADVRAAIERLLASSSSPAGDAALLEQLARRSLARARARGRRRC